MHSSKHFVLLNSHLFNSKISKTSTWTNIILSRSLFSTLFTESMLKFLSYVTFTSRICLRTTSRAFFHLVFVICLFSTREKSRLECLIIHKKSNFPCENGFDKSLILCNRNLWTEVDRFKIAVISLSWHWHKSITSL